MRIAAMALAAALAGCAGEGGRAAGAVRDALAREVTDPGVGLRGFVLIDRAGARFRPCGEEIEMLVADSTGDVLRATYARLSGGPSEPVYAELRGNATGVLPDGPPVALTVTGVRYAAPADATLRCADDLDSLEFRASGAAPSWAVSIASSGIVFTQDAAPGRIELPYAAPGRDSAAVLYATHGGAPSGHRLEVRIVAERCADAAGGSESALTARVTLDGRFLSGCARRGAAPIPAEVDAITR